MDLLAVSLFDFIDNLTVYIHEGYGSSVAPTYINEVSPRHLRGTLGASFQLGVVVLLFFSQAISLHPVLGSADKWNYALGNKINEE